MMSSALKHHKTSKNVALEYRISEGRLTLLAQKFYTTFVTDTQTSSLQLKLKMYLSIVYYKHSKNFQRRGFSTLSTPFTEGWYSNRKGWCFATSTNQAQCSSYIASTIITMQQVIIQNRIFFCNSLISFVAMHAKEALFEQTVLNNTLCKKVLFYCFCVPCFSLEKASGQLYMQLQDKNMTAKRNKHKLQIQSRGHTYLIVEYSKMKNTSWINRNR